MHIAQAEIFDDTCYLLPIEDPVDAAIAHAILTSAGVQRFLESVKYPGAKRPVTKKLLERIDLAMAAEMADSIDLVNRAQAQLGDLASVNASDVECFVGSMIEPQGVPSKLGARCPQKGSGKAWRSGVDLAHGRLDH